MQTPSGGCCVFVRSGPTPGDAWLRRLVRGLALLSFVTGMTEQEAGTDMLRSRKSRREEPLGAQVTEPSVVGGEGADPEGKAVLADLVGVALLVVLDTLTPVERLAFVLHDLFAMPFAFASSTSRVLQRRL
jgi:RNA polymerase sigma-70 factor (ECF subfamily)